MDAVTVGLLRDGACELSERVTGSAGLVAILRFLESESPSGRTDVAEVLASFLNAARMPGVVIVLSDFWSETDIAPPLRHAAERGFEGSLLQMLTPEEIDPDYAGRSRLVDGESLEEIEFIVSQQTREAYVEEVGRFHEELASAATGAGFRATRLRSDMAVEDAVLRELRSAGVVS
jgi:hypothetical protein